MTREMSERSEVRMTKKIVLLAFGLLLLSASAMAQSLHYERAGLPLTGGTITGTPGPELAPAIGAGTGYTCGAGWDCSVAGVLNKNADGTGTVEPNPAITAVVGSTYRVILTLGAVTVGNGATYTFGGTTGTTALTAATTYTHYVTATTTASLIITPTPTTTRFTITAVSVRLSAGDLEVQGKGTFRRGIEVNVGGSCSFPSITSADADSGFGFLSGLPTVPAICSNAGVVAYGTGGLLVVPGGVQHGSAGTYLTSPSAAVSQLGLANAAAPVAQTLQSQGSRAGTDTDIAGGNLIITSGNGTGNAAGSNLIFQTPTPVGSGTGAQTMTTRLAVVNSAATFQNLVSVLGPRFVSSNSTLTTATMTPFSPAILYTATAAFDWTNAMIVALGGVGTGDISVATLPAKTQLLDAMVVIITPDTSANALTVQCGDSGVFNQYTVASDAKAAANTVYGDALAERGTAIDVEHYYLPSYTATTTVTCRFIKSVTNLNTVTGSTGRVILTTRLLP